MLIKKAMMAAPSIIPVLISDVFKITGYVGNNSTLNINNGFDLSTNSGLIWAKDRDNNFASYALFNTVRGRAYSLNSDADSQERGPSTAGRDLSSFNSNGFTLGQGEFCSVNENGDNHISWSWREYPKFFDIVTYTGNGSNRTISHNLDSVPGMIIVKDLGEANRWAVYHRYVGNTAALDLNTSEIAETSATFWNNTNPTSTVFTVGTNVRVNKNGGNFIAFLFAHNAGGFGGSASDNVISCDGYTGNGSSSGPAVNLGYEPQFLIIKRTSPSSTFNSWCVIDSVRGFTGTSDKVLKLDLTNSESSGNFVKPTATGFEIVTSSDDYNNNGSNYAYIAIRKP